MKKKLEEALVSIAHRILKQEGKEDLASMHTATRELYEKLTLLKFVEDNFGEMQPASKRNEIAEKFEQLANSVLKGNLDVPENNPNEDVIMTPVIDTIRDMVQEMPKEETLEEILSGILPEPAFVKRDMDTVTPKITDIDTVTVEKKGTSLNDKLKAGLSIGLNDKLAFKKHLFNDSNEDYIRVISQINTMDSYEEVRQFITEIVKPDYNNWEGKEAYENRFLEVIENKFS